MASPLTRAIQDTLEFMLGDDPDLVKQTLAPDLLEMELKYFAIRNNTKQVVPVKELTIGECLTASVLLEEQAIQLYRQANSLAFALVLQETPDQAFFGDKQ